MSPSTTPLSFSLYVNSFVYFSEDPKVKSHFCQQLAERCKVNFMDGVEWFLEGPNFHCTLILPWWQFISINPVLQQILLKVSHAFPEMRLLQLHRIALVYPLIWLLFLQTTTIILPSCNARRQIRAPLVEFGWLALTTCPDLSAVHSFLSSYSNKPAISHMKAALYTLHYIHSTQDYGISFMLDDMAPIHSYIHYLPYLDVEAYSNAVPPKLGSSSTISPYGIDFWGSQIGSAVANIRSSTMSVTTLILCQIAQKCMI